MPPPDAFRARRLLRCQLLRPLLPRHAIRRYAPRYDTPLIVTRYDADAATPYAIAVIATR